MPLAGRGLPVVPVILGTVTSILAALPVTSEMGMEGPL